MISEETVWQEIWPQVEKLLEGTLQQEATTVRRQLAPGSDAADIFDLYGVPVFDILLKTVLGRSRMAVTRAIETENGKYVHIEFVWPDPELADKSYTAADLVTVSLKRYRQEWRVMAINPAAADFPLTEPRAIGILTTSKVLSKQDNVPQEPWLLPVALLGGNLQLPLRSAAMQDEVEQLFMPGLQHRTFGILSLIASRRLWRAFKKKAKPQLAVTEAWAAAVEYIMSEQTGREPTQAAVAKHYNATLTQMLPRVKQIKRTLKIEGLDERYSPLGSTQIVFKGSETD